MFPAVIEAVPVFVLCWGSSVELRELWWVLIECWTKLQPNRSSITPAARTHLRFNVPGSFTWQQLNLQGTHSCQTGGQEQIRSNQCEPCNVASSLSDRRSNTALAQCFKTPFRADLSVSGMGWSSSCCVPGKTGFSADHETGFIKLPLWLITALAKWAYRERALASLHLQLSLQWCESQ